MTRQLRLALDHDTGARAHTMRRLTADLSLRLEEKARREHVQALVNLGALRVLQETDETRARRALDVLARVYREDVRLDMPMASEDAISRETRSYMAAVLALVERIIVSGGLRPGHA